MKPNPHNPFIETLVVEHKVIECIHAQNLHCPVPLLKLKKALAKVKKDETIYIITTDANSPKDIIRFCERAQHTILYHASLDAVDHLIIKKGM